MPLFIQEFARQYREQGYCLIPNLIPTKAIDAALQRITTIADNLDVWPSKHFQVFDPDRYTSVLGRPLPGGVQRPASQESVFADIADHPRLIESMIGLLGGEVERYTDQIGLKHGFISEEQGGRSFFHQDSFYWHIDPELGCNCWIPLTEVGVDASTLAVMPDSQKGWHLVDHESYYDDPPMGSIREKRFEPFKRHRVPKQLVDSNKEEMITIEPGGGLFFSNYTWHRSEPNRSGQTRVFYAIAYQRKD